MKYGRHKFIKVLQYNNVPATFFVVGDQAQRYTDTLRLLADKNFLVGNPYIFTPDITNISKER